MKYVSINKHLGLSLAFTALTWASTASAASLSVIYTFAAGANGMTPVGGPIRDAGGALYGVTLHGGNGSPGLGVVNKLAPPAAGQTAWSYTVLHRFTSGADGSWPMGELVFDKAGALYGATSAGGRYGAGVIYKLSPPAAGQTTWRFSTLYTFTGGVDGSWPMGPLRLDPAGSIFGVTLRSGLVDAGTLFRLSPPRSSTGLWEKSTIIHFGRVTGGPYGPSTALYADQTGALYGGTNQGGNSMGTIYRLAMTPSGWSGATLHRYPEFQGDGWWPTGNLLFGADGGFYGETMLGGRYLNGSIFKFTPPAPGQTRWTQSILYSFDINTKDGSYPNALAPDGAGGLFGATLSGGAYTLLSGSGTVFRLRPPAPGRTAWTKTILHSFDGTDGHSPVGAIAVDPAGTIYGVTQHGGAAKLGNIYKLTTP